MLWFIPFLVVTAIIATAILLFMLDNKLDAQDMKGFYTAYLFMLILAYSLFAFVIIIWF